MRIATIDIGTNCVLLLVAETEGGALRPVLERATITRLGEGVDRNRRLLPEACERTLACLSEYGRTLRELGVTHLDAVGTSAMRDAAGGEQFVLQAAHTLGIAPRVIDGNEEARLTFAGALSGLPVAGKVMAFDIGGGSTEVVVGESGSGGRRIASAVSLDIGSVRLFERHVRSDPPTLAELQNVEQDIAAALRSAPKPEHGATLVGVAGTVTQLAALDLELAQYDAARVHGSKLSLSTVDRLATQLASQSVAVRRALRGMEPARADVIVVGSAIARAVLHWSNAEELTVSDRGVRWGLAEELAARGSRGAQCS
ncbi:MAG TPA: Ppx/GppA phosphatase family protein [Polyangiaceae bacterium]|jgi:exopolyphosphatase/guanosine-5'-triphosphate,3'-diphosphate pyrophosphatase|nr:Ppx/GppA phosphatase family protein [Polyangiaceae bacterium]